MLRRALSIVLLAWAFGFIWFAVALPQPLAGGKTDAIAVPTGGKGRIARGLDELGNGLAPRMLVSGVAREVRPHEFALEYKVAPETMACCITLGFASVDTRSNATEIADWLKANRARSVRLVTSDWHMRRAAYELRLVLPKGVTVIEDAVPTRPSLRVLFLEYHKLLARRISRIWRA
ncbi:MAG: YdcF family protein [Novosphingobium sp.]